MKTVQHTLYRLLNCSTKQRYNQDTQPSVVLEFLERILILTSKKSPGLNTLRLHSPPISHSAVTYKLGERSVAGEATPQELWFTKTVMQFSYSPWPDQVISSGLPTSTAKSPQMCHIIKAEWFRHQTKNLLRSCWTGFNHADHRWNWRLCSITFTSQINGRHQPKDWVITSIPASIP